MALKERQSTDDAPLLVDRPPGDPTDPRGTPSPSQRRDLRIVLGLAVCVLGLLSASAGDDRRRRQP